MNATRQPNGDLKITVSPDERRVLRACQEEQGDAFGADVTLFDVFERFIANSEFDWCRPEEIGALTAAPCLCLRDGRGTPTEAWGFMSYQITSPQNQLADCGECVFQHGGPKESKL